VAAPCEYLHKARIFKLSCRFADSMGMAGPPESTSQRHFSGINVRIVVRYLQERFGPDILAQVLRMAGERRDETKLCDDSVWSSYTQVRSLFEATSAVLGGAQWLTTAAIETPINSESGAEVAHTLQDLGSPDALLRIVVDSDAALGVSTIRITEGDEIAPCEWTIRERFRPGFEAFKEYCAFTAGMLAMLPKLFGLPVGDVTEEQCCCDGASSCMFRVRWQPTVDVSRGRDYFETRCRLLEARLEALQHTVSQLVSAPDPIEGLSAIVDAAARAMFAPSFVLTIDGPRSSGLRILSIGVEGAAAESIGREIAVKSGRDVPGRLVVEVASTRMQYGWFAAIDPGARRFLNQERAVLSSYADLAAAALDSASALEESRHQAATKGALLDLSQSLSRVLTSETMAAELVRTVPKVLDCDRSMVLLIDPDTEKTSIAATHGYPTATAKRLESVRFPRSAVESLESDILYHDADDIAGLQSSYGLSITDDTAALVSVPMLAGDVTIGGLLVSVTSGRERLFDDPELADALRGLAGQGAMAISNARLIDRMRHQALHDALTGLPNRLLVLDRAEQILTRARREGTGVGALFIDLDGFKEINDSLGHAVGDKLLAVLAKRFQAVMRESDTVGRLGGDEFVALLEGESLENGADFAAKRLLEAASEPFECDGLRLAVTASIGVALGDRSSADELLRDADIALYQAKNTGKNCYVVYRPDTSPVVLTQSGGTSGSPSI
jgi:diguanylate cyclase (GGDEF)-like protein